VNALYKMLLVPTQLCCKMNLLSVTVTNYNYKKTSRITLTRKL